MSDDGEHAITIIGLVGNPFSRGSRPLERAALNVALYSHKARAWTLRDRTISEAHRTVDTLELGASAMRWVGDALVVTIDERTSPFGRPLRGTVTVRPELTTTHAVSLAPGHTWWPLVPLARIEVALTEPSVHFSGHGYIDANRGDTPLQDAFDTWCWSRARHGDTALVTYDAIRRDGTTSSATLKLSATGLETITEVVSPLPKTSWGLTRSTRGTNVQLARSLEDGPFYARALVRKRLAGYDVVAVHEVLSAKRLAQRWVQFLAGFRMGRVA